MSASTFAALRDFASFFEEINLVGEGGLYRELIRNRSFSSSASPDYWSAVAQGTTGWLVNSGTWASDTCITPNAFSQSANGQNYRATFSMPGSTAWKNYTLTLQACSVTAAEPPFKATVGWHRD